MICEIMDKFLLIRLFCMPSGNKLIISLVYIQREEFNAEFRKLIVNDSLQKSSGEDADTIHVGCCCDLSVKIFCIGNSQQELKDWKELNGKCYKV